MNEPQPTPWTCPSCGASRQAEPDDSKPCAHCGWKPVQQHSSPSPFRYLLVGMSPTPAFLFLMNFKNLPNWVGPSLIIATIGCSLTAGFGLLSRAKSPITQGLGGLALAVVFFVFNLALAIAVGCSRMGRIAP